jgi:hypothetical protein
MTICPLSSSHSTTEPGATPSRRRTSAGTDTCPCEVRRDLAIATRLHYHGNDTDGMLSGLMRFAVGVIVVLMSYPTAAQTPRSGTYASAEIDAAGRLRITTSSGRTITVPKERDQSSFANPVVSTDRTAVGAQANYPNCCTSYDIPLQLIVYAGGKVHRFKGTGLPIFVWHFADGGTRVAYGQEPVHFGCETHYELRDVQSERLLAAADIPQPCGLRPDPPETTVPEWVKALNAANRQ